VKLKVLLKLGFVNATLLMLYIGSDYLEWRNLLGLPGIADVLWTPIRITIWISSTNAFGPAIIDGVSWMDNWSFIILLTIIAVNLITVWRIEQRKTSLIH
jgi:hypothetical protein